jgi:hypothetical protein
MEVSVHIDDTELVRDFAAKLKAQRDAALAKAKEPKESVEARLKRQAEEARQKFLKVKHEI